MVTKFTMLWTQIVKIPMTTISWTWRPLPIRHQVASRCLLNQTSPMLRSWNHLKLTPSTTQLLSTPPDLLASPLHPPALPHLLAPIPQLVADLAQRPLLSQRSQTGSISGIETERRRKPKSRPSSLPNTKRSKDLLIKKIKTTRMIWTLSTITNLSQVKIRASWSCWSERMMISLCTQR